MPPSILDAIEGGGTSEKQLTAESGADRFPYAGMIRFRFTGYDLSPAPTYRSGTPPTLKIELKGMGVKDAVQAQLMDYF